MAVEPAQKRTIRASTMQGLIVEASLQGRDRYLGPDALYDSFLARNSTQDVCSIIAAYIPECNTRLRVLIVEKLLSRMHRHPFMSSLDSQLNLLGSLVVKKIPCKAYINLVLRNSSRHDVLKHIFTSLNTNDPIAFSKAYTLLLFVLEATTPINLAIQLVLAFICNKLQGEESIADSSASASSKFAQCSSLFFKFLLRLHHAYSPFLVHSLLSGLPPNSTKAPVTITNLSTIQLTNESAALMAYLHFFQYQPSYTSSILQVILCINNTPNAISLMYDQVRKLASQPGLFMRQGLAIMEAITWSVYIYSSVNGVDPRFSALLSSALDTFESVVTRAPIPATSLRHICFLLVALIKASTLTPFFKDRVYNLLNAPGRTILEFCLNNGKEHAGDVSSLLVRTFADLTATFPEYIFNFFLLVMQQSMCHNVDLALSRTTLTMLSSVLKHLHSRRLPLISKGVALHLYQSLENMLSTVEQIDRRLYSLLSDTFSNIFVLAGLIPNANVEIVTKRIVPFIERYVQQDVFAKGALILSIYTTLLLIYMGDCSEHCRGNPQTKPVSPDCPGYSTSHMDGLFRSLFALTSSQFQLLTPDTDMVHFTAVCRLLSNIFMCRCSLTFEEVRSVVSFLPVISSQIHESLGSLRTEDKRQEATYYLVAMYNVITTVSSHIHRAFMGLQTSSQILDQIAPDIFRCIRLIPDALECANSRILEGPVLDTVVATGKISQPSELFLILLSGASTASRASRLIMIRAVASTVLAVGVGKTLPFLLVSYGAVFDRSVKLSLLRAIAYIFDDLSLAHACTPTVTRPGPDCCESCCTTYMSLLDGFTGVVSHALAERDSSVRMLGIRAIGSMLFSCTPLQQGAPLLHHLISMYLPNILDLCDRTLSDSFQRSFEALQYRFGTGVAATFVYSGLFHVAKRVQQAYRLTYDSLRLHRGLVVDMFGPDFSEILRPVPPCLAPPDLTLTVKHTVSAKEWLFGERDQLDFECTNLFTRI